MNFSVPTKLLSIATINMYESQRMVKIIINTLMVIVAISALAWANSIQRQVDILYSVTFEYARCEKDFNDEL